MQERQRPVMESGGGGPGFDDLFPDARGTGMVTVQAGPYAEQIPVARMTVAEVRARFQDHFHITAEFLPVIDGSRADEDTVLREGQMLTFMREGGTKGTAAPARVVIEGEFLHTVAPDTGQPLAMPVTEFLDVVARPRPDTGGIAMPAGGKFLFSRHRGLVLVHETPPRAHLFTWITRDSEQPHGDGATYDKVRVALPYVVLIVRFEEDTEGRYRLSSRNECFVRNGPIRGDDGELFFPPLLNCSKMNTGDGIPLSWVCTQHLDRSTIDLDDGNRGVTSGLDALLRHLFETGFNLSSEHNELSSWFTETRKARIDPRLDSIESWQAATTEDPLFALDVPWLSTGMTIRQIAERPVSPRSRPAPLLVGADDCVRVMVNHQNRTTRTEARP